MNIPGHLRLFPDAIEASKASAEAFVRSAQKAVAERGRFSVALTGGSSPRDLYRLLATPAFADRIPWSGVHVFWGDERCVPPAHPRSNFGMANSLLLAHVPLPSGNIHRIRGELGAAAAAREYAATLRSFFSAALPRFDLVHLGVGGDAHIASLFPFDHVRLLERHHAVMPSLRRESGEFRVTLTPPAINAAHRVEVLLVGSDKARVARRVLAGALDPLRLPAQLVRPVNGELVWLVSRDAARMLQSAGRN